MCCFLPVLCPTEKDIITRTRSRDVCALVPHQVWSGSSMSSYIKKAIIYYSWYTTNIIRIKILCFTPYLGERERAHLVVQTAEVRYMRLSDGVTLHRNLPSILAFHAPRHHVGSPLLNFRLSRVGAAYNVLPTRSKPSFARRALREAP